MSQPSSTVRRRSHSPDHDARPPPHLRASPREDVGGEANGSGSNTAADSARDRDGERSRPSHSLLSPRLSPSATRRTGESSSLWSSKDATYGSSLRGPALWSAQSTSGSSSYRSSQLPSFERGSSWTSSLKREAAAPPAIGPRPGSFTALLDADRVRPILSSRPSRLSPPPRLPSFAALQQSSSYDRAESTPASSSGNAVRSGLQLPLQQQPLPPRPGSSRRISSTTSSSRSESVKGVEATSTESISPLGPPQTSLPATATSTAATTPLPQGLQHGTFYGQPQMHPSLAGVPGAGGGPGSKQQPSFVCKLYT